MQQSPLCAFSAYSAMVRQAVTTESLLNVMFSYAACLAVHPPLNCRIAGPSAKRSAHAVKAALVFAAP